MKGTLQLIRFNGIESRELNEGAFSITQDAEEKIINLWAKSEGKLLTKPLDDTMDAYPTVEFQTILTTNDIIDLNTKGIEVNEEKVKSDDERIFAHLYYYGHQDIFSFELKIIERKDDNYHIMAEGLTTDVNFYDESKPKSKLILNCWVRISEVKTGYWT